MLYWTFSVYFTIHSRIGLCFTYSFLYDEKTQCCYRLITTVSKWIVNHGRHDLCPITQKIFTHSKKTNTWTCVDMTQHVGGERGETLRWIYSVFMGCFYDGVASLKGHHRHRWSRGHARQHQALFAQVWALPRRLRQRFLLDDLWIRLGHPDNSLHSSAVMLEKKKFIYMYFYASWTVRSLCLYADKWKSKGETW